MTNNNSKSYFTYLDKLVDEYNNNYNNFIDKKAVDADYSGLTKETEFNHIALGFLAMITLKIGQKKYLWLVWCWKLNLGYIKLKI